MHKGPVPLNDLTIKLWPEFDDPRLLVIIDGELQQTDQPVNVPVPAGAFINAVASAETDGRLLNIAWESGTDASGNSVVTLTPQTPLFRIEYYIPLTVQSDQRTIDFVLPANTFSANSGSIEILLPPGSTEVVLDPAEDASQPTADGALLYGRDLGTIAADQAISQTITYRNSTGAMTMPETPKEAVVSPPPSPPTSTPTATTSPNWLLIGLASVAVLLIVLGGYGLWRTSRPEPELEPESPAPKRRRKPKSKTSPAGSDQFCRKCGTSFFPKDRFCRKCGSKRH
ncbi:MAG: hypothetical protein GXP37_08925 [Chloroflexi bacterium]|nr:hypothetical protein [Chloroflexota bacterium]